MNGVFGWILSLTRAVGHTTAACGNETDREPVVVFPTTRQAVQASLDHGARTMSMQEHERLLGDPRPVIFDVESVKMIVQAYEGEIRRLRDRAEQDRKTIRARVVRALDSLL